MKLDEYSRIKGVSVTFRRGMLRVKLAASLGGGKVIDKCFSSELDALTHLQDWLGARKQASEASREMSTGEIEDAYAAIKHLRSSTCDLSLLEVARQHVSRAGLVSDLSVNQLVARFIDHSEKLKRTPIHIKGLRNYYRKFSKLFGDHLLHQVSTSDVTDWLSVVTVNRAAGTYNNHLASIKSMFNYSVKRKWLLTSPVTGIEKITVAATAVCIFTPAELQKVLYWCASPFVKMGIRSSHCNSFNH